LPIISKSQLLNDATSDYLDPTLRGQMAFVVGSTITLTGQQADLSVTMNGVAQLQAGTTQQGFVNQLWTSDAHRQMQVNAIYAQVLNRAPTAQEKAAGVAQLNTGTDPLTLTQNLYVSNEFQQLHPTTDGLAQALSQSILNTTPGTADLQTLVQSMGAEPLSTVVHDLLNSDASLGNLIDSAYHQTLRRAATAAEIQTWTTQLKANAITLGQLTQRLLASQEFYQLAFNNIH
jgi:hypothetical protein